MKMLSDTHNRSLIQRAGSPFGVILLACSLSLFLSSAFVYFSIGTDTPDMLMVGRLCMALGVETLAVVLLMGSASFKDRILPAGQRFPRLLDRGVIAFVLVACLTSLGIAYNTYDIDNQFISATTTRNFLFVLFPLLGAVLSLFLFLVPRVVRINLVVLVSMWCLAEIGFAIPRLSDEKLTQAVVGDTSKANVSNEEASRIANLDTGNVVDLLAPVSRRVIAKSYGDELIYRSHVESDSLGRRHTPLSANGNRDRFLLLFGGSFMFGEGLNDEETLPARLGELMPDHRPYNYGRNGWGPSQMLDILRTRDLRREVREETGTAMYLFIDDHVRRVVGSLSFYMWGDQLSRYVQDRNGDVVFGGTFVTSNPLKIIFYKLLYKSFVLQRFNFDIPFSYSDKDLELVAKVIDKSRRLLESTYPGIDFRVLIHPGKNGARLIAQLEKLGIKYMDLNGKFVQQTPKYRLHNLDYHPSAAWHALIAPYVVRSLRHDVPTQMNRTTFRQDGAKQF